MSSTARARILIVDDDPSLRRSLRILLEHAGHDVRAVATAAAALTLARDEPIDLALLDLRLGTDNGMDLIEPLRRSRPELAAIMITAAGTIESAVAAMRLGADDYLTKPIDPASLLGIVAKALAARSTDRSREPVGRHPSTVELIASSAAMAEVAKLARTIAGRDTTVILTGETGTGKGVLARFIHEQSRRADDPFVELNCAGFHRELVESELFGHEKGAFSGAVERKSGLIEAAERGTLVLDEIGEMELPIQAKLLRVLETRRFRRLGEVTELEADVRVIAATHRDLPREVASGRFREDLYFRLSVFEIRLPALRDRRDDLPLLANRFLQQLLGPEAELTAAAIAGLQTHRWPGNVRELRNVMERAAILAGGQVVDRQHLPPFDTAQSASSQPLAPAFATIAERDRLALVEALRRHGGDVRAAAGALGISRSTAYRWLKQLGMAESSPDDHDLG